MLVFGFYRAVTPEQFAVSVSIELLAMVIVGGLGSIIGSFLGTAFILSSIHRWMTNTDKHLANYLIPVGILAIVIGIGLLVMTSAVYVFGRNRLQMAAASPVSDPG